MRDTVLLADNSAEGVTSYALPALTRTTSQALLLAYAVNRSDNPDTPFSGSTIELRRSTDHGLTWSDPITVFGDTPALPSQGFTSPSFITDLVTGQVFLMATQYLDADVARSKTVTTKDALVRILLAFTDDDGQTWRHRDISVQVNGANNWLTRHGLSGHGIQLKQGIWTGRMVQAVRVVNQEGQRCFIAVCSDDHGRTWWSGLPIEGDGIGAAVAELSDGRVVMQTLERGEGQAIIVKRYYSMDGARSFGPGLVMPAPHPLGDQNAESPDEAPDISAFTALLAQAGMVNSDDNTDTLIPRWAAAFERCFPCAIPGMEQARAIMLPTVRPVEALREQFDADDQIQQLGMAVSLNDGQTVHHQVAYVHGEVDDVDVISMPELRLAITAVQSSAGIEIAHVLLDDLGLKTMAYGWNERPAVQDEVLASIGLM